LRIQAIPLSNEGALSLRMLATGKLFRKKENYIEK
jgi:hypothetical protein